MYQAIPINQDLVYSTNRSERKLTPHGTGPVLCTGCFIPLILRFFNLMLYPAFLPHRVKKSRLLLLKIEIPT